MFGKADQGICEVGKKNLNDDNRCTHTLMSNTSAIAAMMAAICSSPSFPRCSPPRIYHAEVNPRSTPRGHPLTTLAKRYSP